MNQLNKLSAKRNYRRVSLAAMAAFVASFQSLLGLPALAESISFTPEDNTNGGAIVGRIPLEKFGAIDLPRGRVSFKSHFIEVSAIPEYQFDRQVVLSGPILKCSSINAGSKVYLNGFA